MQGAILRVPAIPLRFVPRGQTVGTIGLNVVCFKGNTPLVPKVRLGNPAPAGRIAM